MSDGLQINSREDVAKVLHDLRERMVKAEESGRGVDDVRGQLDTMKRDLTEANRRLAELGATRTETLSGDDARLRQYVAKDGGVRLAGGYDQETRQHLPGLLDDVSEDANHAWQREAQRIVTDHNIVRSVLGKDAALPVMQARLKRHIDLAPEALKRAPGWSQTWERAFVNSSGVGSNWIIALGLPEVARDPRLRSPLQQMFRRKPVATATETLPYMTTGLRPYKKVAASGDDPAQFTSSSLATAARTISAVGMVVRAQVDRDASEDAIINASALIQDEAVNALRDGWEDCAINGDTAATHGDTIASWDPNDRWGSSGLGGSGDHRRTFLGFRQLGLDVSGASGDGSGAETYAGMISWRSALRAPQGVLQDLLYVVSPTWYLLKILTMTEFKTVDVAGPGAANVTGVVASVGGVRVLVSEYLTSDMNASGVYDNSTKTKTGGLCIATSRFWVTERQGNVVELETDITRDIHNVVVKNRVGLFDLDAGAKKNVYYAYKLSTS